MASPANVVDVDQLLVRCGYTASTARYVRKTSSLWKGSRVVSLTEAIEKLEALVDAKPRRRLLQHRIPKVLGELKEELRGASQDLQAPDDSGTLAQALESIAGLAGPNRGASLRMSQDNLPSLIDTVALLTGKTGKRSAECAKNIINKYFDDDTKITYSTEKSVKTVASMKAVASVKSEQAVAKEARVVSDVGGVSRHSRRRWGS
jgi:hypothetical protein